MIKNISNLPLYLEAGLCYPGDLIEATDTEIKRLIRQNGIVELVPDSQVPYPTEHVNPEPVPVKEANKEPLIPKPQATPDPDLIPGDWPDEFGPAKGSDEWGALLTNKKISITVRRNNKYGPP